LGEHGIFQKKVDDNNKLVEAEQICITNVTVNETNETTETNETNETNETTIAPLEVTKIVTSNSSCYKNWYNLLKQATIVWCY
jgi:hypothetical protein